MKPAINKSKETKDVFIPPSDRIGHCTQSLTIQLPRPYFWSVPFCKHRIHFMHCTVRVLFQRSTSCVKMKRREKKKRRGKNNKMYLAV